MSPLSLYFLLKLDSVASLCKGVSVVLFVLIIASLMLSLLERLDMVADIDDGDKVWKHVKPQLRWSLPIACFFLLVHILLPSTKQMAAIIVVPKVISGIEANKELMSLPNDIASLASSWINELHPKVVKESAKTITQQE